MKRMLLWVHGHGSGDIVETAEDQWDGSWGKNGAERFRVFGKPDEVIAEVQHIFTSFGTKATVVREGACFGLYRGAVLEACDLDFSDSSRLNEHRLIRKADVVLRVKEIEHAMVNYRMIKIRYPGAREWLSVPKRLFLHDLHESPDESVWKELPDLSEDWNWG